MADDHHYALWLIPEPRAGGQLAAVIGELAESHDGPRFAPHLTLLGGVTGSERSLAARMATLARRLAPLRLGVRGISGEPHFFRCLYLRLDDTRPLLAAHSLAAELFDCDSRDVYRPHASLYYGQLAGSEQERLRTALTARLPDEIELDRLQLVRITAAVSGWCVVAEAVLG